MRVLILADIPGWIVDRITDRMIAGMPEIDWRKGFYGCLETREIIEMAQGCDLIHYQNWDLQRHLPGVFEAGTPVLVSIRSHRYPSYVPEAARRARAVHVVSPALLGEFPGARYIPDGLMIEPQPLRVGFAGKPDAYKGYPLIEQACREIGAEFRPALDVAPDQMLDYYRSVDVIVCASEAEGASTVVMEALACNRPVVSTRAGVPYQHDLPGVDWVDRSVEAIKAALLKRWPSRMLDGLRWPTVCRDFARLYKKVAT